MKKVFMTFMVLSLLLAGFHFMPMNAEAEDYSFFAYGNCSLTQLGSGFVEIVGETQAYLNVDTVRATLYLQQFKNGEWQTVQYVQFSSDYSDSVYGYRQYFVEKNYNYRVCAIHYVRLGSIAETAESMTGQLFID